MKKRFNIIITNPFSEPIRKKILDFSLFIALFLILEYEYYDFINIPLFREKMGFDFSFSIWRYIAGKGLLALALYINLKMKSFNYFANTLILIFLTFPVIILFEFMPNTPLIISLSAVFFHLVYFSTTRITIDNQWLKTLKLNDTQKLLVIIILALITTIPIILTFGFDLSLKAFNPYKVYEVRAASSLKIHGLANYFYSWLIKIIIPIGLILSLKNRKWIWIIVFFLLQIYLFMTEAHKSAFISLFVVFVMLIKTYEKQVRWFLFTVIFMIIAAKLFSIISGDIMAESIVVRRTFFLPAIIINDYFDFFAQNHTYLSHSIFRHFVDYPFDLDPPHLIGREFFGNINNNSNSGFISDGFMNFGYLGILLYSFAMAFVLKIIDILRISPIYSGVFIIIIYTFLSSYFLTTLLSHGVILFLILATFLLRNTIDQR